MYELNRYNLEIVEILKSSAGYNRRAEIMKSISASRSTTEIVRFFEYPRSTVVDVVEMYKFGMIFSLRTRVIWLSIFNIVCRTMPTCFGPKNQPPTAQIKIQANNSLPFLNVYLCRNELTLYTDMTEYRKSCRSDNTIPYYRHSSFHCKTTADDFYIRHVFEVCSGTYLQQELDKVELIVISYWVCN